MISTEAHRRFRELLEPAKRIVLTTHVNPDGDALGSEFSLARYLASKGKHVRIINQDPAPDMLRFIVDESPALELYDPTTHDPVLRDADLVVLLDNSAPDRLGRMESAMLAEAGHTLCIDHHPCRDAPWGHQILDEGSCATAVMVFELTRAAGWTPDRRAAQAIFVGLATDTGFFRFNSTNARAHEVAAELHRLGIEPSGIYQAVYERNSVAYTRLLGHALTGLEVHALGRVVSVKITGELVRRLEAEQEDTSEITTALLALAGIRVALLFRELPDGRIKVSLRSKGGVDVHGLASEFGGGGHRNASGIVMPGRLDDVARAVTERATALAGREPKSPEVTVEVRFFASLAEVAGRASETVDLDASAGVEDLWTVLVERHPAFGRIGYRPMVACDRTYAGWDRRLEGVREVAFLPPVSGG